MTTYAEIELNKSVYSLELSALDGWKILKDTPGDPVVKSFPLSMQPTNAELTIYHYNNGTIEPLKKILDFDKFREFPEMLRELAEIIEKELIKC